MSSLLSPNPPPPLSQYFPNLFFFLSLQAGTRKACLSSRGGQNDDFRPLNYTLWGWAWGAGTNMWHPETPASYESLPAPLATQIPTLWIHTSGGGSSDIRLMSSIRPMCKCRCPPLLSRPLMGEGRWGLTWGRIWTLHKNIRGSLSIYSLFGQVPLCSVNAILNTVLHTLQRGAFLNYLTGNFKCRNL